MSWLGAGDRAHRRQLTVLFCDVAGSTEILEALNEEHWAYALREYYSSCRSIIESYGGQVAQYLGDGLLAYFGFPTAHENDPHRAVKAALELTSQIGVMNARVRTAIEREHRPLSLRVAIHTGLVVIEELGRDAFTERIALGMVPTIAARLQQETRDNTVVISGATYELIEGVFECRSLGRLRLKGISVSHTAYEVIRECPRQSRFETTVSKGLTEFVGRQELVGLRALWDEVRNGRGRVVLIEGDPGIGKSRLVVELLEELRATEARSFVCSASPWYGNRTHMSRDLSVEWLLREAASQPVVLFIDDLQWMDDGSRALLGDLIAAIPPHPVLIIIATRPGPTLPWQSSSHVQHLALGPLSRRAAEALARNLIGSRTLAPELAHRLVTHTDGVPLFLEEFTLMMLTDQPRELQAIPASLHGLLMECLDRLGPARELAKLAAAMGSESSRELLSAVALCDDATLQTHLDTLVSQGILIRQESADGIVYGFKYALVRDIAYHSLLARSRKRIHERVAEVTRRRDQLVH